MKLLVTGASGFVGRHVVARFPDAIALGSEMDLRSNESVVESLGKYQFDRVLHLAAQSSIPEAFRDPAHTFDVNFYGTFRLLRALLARRFQGRVLFIGSGDMYGPISPADLPIQEDRMLKPLNPYAVSKVAAEALCYQMSQEGQLDIVMARPFNHIGPGQSDAFAVSNFAKQMVEIRRGLKPPVIHVGNLESTRDFSDVRDVVSAYGLLLEQGERGQVYNVCSGREHAMREVLERLQELADVRCEIIVEGGRLRPTDSPRVRGSAEKIVKRTGWKPEIDFDKSLRDLIMDWEKRLK